MNDIKIHITGKGIDPLDYDEVLDMMLMLYMIAKRGGSEMSILIDGEPLIVHHVSMSGEKPS